MRPFKLLALSMTLATATVQLAAFDKNGVAPRAISLPTGPGSIQGLGESFQPQLNTGSGSYNVPLVLPRGPGGQTPSLSLVYNTGTRNGPIGIGWMLAGVPSIRRSTDRGIPLYTDGPNGIDDDLEGRIDNGEELDVFTGANGEELVPLADGSFRAETEGSFWRYTRAAAGWEARSPDGKRLIFGMNAAARVESDGKIFEWCLEQQIDRNGNTIAYEYQGDPATPARKYLKRLRWGTANAFFAAVFLYETGRLDAAVNYQTGFELRTSLRMAGIDIFSHGIAAQAFALQGDFDGDGGQDKLIRRFRFEYSPSSHLSLLSRVTLLGADGVSALPTLTLTYSAWTPPDNVASTGIRSINAPSPGPESPSVELIDMNGDGLPDLLSTAGSIHRVALNRGVNAAGRLVFGASQPVGNAPSIDLSSDRTHLADATADGAADLMVKVSNTSFLCYDNTSLISWTGAPFPVRNTDTWPIWPYDGDGGKLSRSFDSDYSRSNDVLHTTESGIQLWLLLREGRYSKEIRLPPLRFEGQTFRFDLPGTHIADLNGDRLLDLAWIQSSRVVYFPSRGRGLFATPIVLPLGRTLTATEIGQAGFSDVDGDGLEDLTLVRPSFLPTGVVYWLNRFDQGLDGPRQVTGLPPLTTGDALRWADMNGNGTTDIVISQAQSAPGEKILVLDLIPDGKIHLLTHVENGLGLAMDFDYESSTQQMVRAEAEGQAWSSVMPIHPTVVASIVENDGRGNVFRQTIAYRDPFYDPRKQEFRGFESAEAMEHGDGSVASKISRQVFDTGRDEACMKGKMLQEEIIGEQGELFVRTAHAYGLRILANGLDGREVCYPFEEATDEFVHEGAAASVQTRKEFQYDDFGNVTFEKRFGILAVPGDELFVERFFEVRPQTWLVNLLAREVTTEPNGNRMAEERHAYDDRGNRLTTEAWLDTENRFAFMVRQRFDAFGNVIEYTDARGNRTEIAFDAVLHAWPTLETVHLETRDLVRSAEYDFGLGVVTRSVDLAGEPTIYVNDALARLAAMDRSGGAHEEYEYTFGNPVSRVIKRLTVDQTGKTFESRMYSDGYGRTLASLVEAEDGRWRFLEGKTFNARKLEAKSFLPFFTNAPEYSDPGDGVAFDASTYDAMGRLLDRRKADGSLSRLRYEPFAVLVSDGNDNAGGGTPDVRRSDGLARMTSVEEKNGAETYITRYFWNVRSQLERIVDAQGNEKRFRFDSLDRLVEVNDPDRGLWKHAYDDNGNRTRREDARGQVTAYSFDAANRTTRRVHLGAGAGGADVVDAICHYDAPKGEIDLGDGTRGTARNCEGRLAWIEDRSGEEHLSYDERGNIEWSVKVIADPITGVLIPYRTQRGHDLLNRENERIFPDNDRLRIVRGEGAFVSRIDGGEGTGALLEEAEYMANGQPLRLGFGNGAASTYAYDAAQRLETLRTTSASAQELLHEKIEYDPASNVAAIVDLRSAASVPLDSARRRTARFRYDELHRLIEASYGDGASAPKLAYQYDPLGNMLRQSTPAAGQPGHIADGTVAMGNWSYQGGRSNRIGRQAGGPPGPHAPTGTENGHQFLYDANGNMTGYDGAALAWDFEQRLTRWSSPAGVADYVFDHTGRRVVKIVQRGNAREETFYPDADFEVESDAPAKYAMLDGRRLARIRGMLDPARERIQRLPLAAGWNLVSVAVESAATLAQAFGAGAAIYQASGASYAPVESSRLVPRGQALWVFVPAARLAVLKGRYPAAGGNFTSTGPLHAWPRLEPFRPQSAADPSAPLMVYNAKTRFWVRRDPLLPSFLSDAPDDLGGARAFWSESAMTLKPPAVAGDSILYYHQDHLGTPALLTDAAGELVEERSHYPFGASRSTHRPAGSTASTRFAFTGKERDGESGLTVMGARSYLDIAGQFLSPDPRFAEVAELENGGNADKTSFAAFLNNPQMGNLYAYSARNPLKYVDPSGLEFVFSKELRDNKAFQEGLALFKKTDEGKRIWAAVEKSGIKVTVQAGRVTGWNPQKKMVTDAYAQVKMPPDRKSATITVNVGYHQAKHKQHDDQVLEYSDSIHHEIRHIEGEQAAQNEGIRVANGVLKTLDQFAKDHKMNVSPMPAGLRIGSEVHRGLDSQNKPNDDPLNAKFRQEAETIQRNERLKAQTNGLLETGDL